MSSMFSNVYNDTKSWLTQQYNSVKAGVQTIDKATQPPTGYPPAEQRSYNSPDKYDISQYTYPMDLMGPQYGGNYVVFYINISDESFLKTKEELYESDPAADPANRKNRVALKFNKHQLAAGQGVTTVASNLVKGLTGGGGKGAVSNLLEGAGTALLVEAAGNQSPENLRSFRRLKSAIALHMPNQLNVRYGTTWGTESAAEMDMAVKGLDGLGNVLGALGNKAGMKKALTDMAPGARDAVSSLALQKGAGKGLSAALGIASNPKLAQTFQGVEFRTFTFDYQFYPRDDSEAENIMKIIHMFKLHMHPEFKNNEANYTWLYPSEFDIQYFTQGAENQYIHKHTSCVLENMQINYTPSGNFSVFQNGMPTQISISLSFKELQLASKETIGQNAGEGL